MVRILKQLTVFVLLLFFFQGESILFAQRQLYLSDYPCRDVDKGEFSEMNYDLWIGGGFATGLDRSKVVYGLHQYLLTVGEFVTPSTWVQLNASYMHTPIQQTTNPTYLIKDGISIIEVGAEIRFYSPSQYSFFGHYFFAGAGLAHAYWDYGGNGLMYDSPVTSGASVWGVEVHFGTGFFLGQSIPITTNLDITPGAVIWFMGTYQGHYDTQLPIMYYLKVRFSLGYAITTL
jgi:hypothetical protein